MSRKRVFDHPWERIFIERVQAGNGAEFDYLISEPNDFVVVVPIIKGKNVLLINQYKHGARQDLLGFPAGFMHAGETAEACAERELAEETHYTARTFRQVAQLSENPTRCRNSYYIVFAEDAAPIPGAASQNTDELEGVVKSKVVAISQLLKPSVLRQMKAGPMLSALPFLLRLEQKEYL